MKLERRVVYINGWGAEPAQAGQEKRRESMADIKNINDAASKIDNLRTEQIQEGVQGGKFQGTNASAVQPPVESPLSSVRPEGGQQLNAKLAAPPIESPLKADRSIRSEGYRFTQSPSLNRIDQPGSEQLFDYAVGQSRDESVRKYLEQDPAASKAVAAVRKGHSEIGSPDAEPNLDQAAKSRLEEIAKHIFRS
jgi:hypothetical protein